MLYLFLLLTAGLNTVANILLKIGSGKVSSLRLMPPIEFLREYWTVGLGLILYAVSAIFYVLLLRLLPLSVAYPIIMAATLIMVNVSSQLYLHEQINTLQLVGYACLIIGITLIFYFRSAP